MTRHVFPTSEIPHLWAHATQRDARNPQGNLYFRDDTIYSYRDSWPLARIFRRKGAAAFVLANSDRYSVTTAGHQNAVERAVSHLPCVSVPHCTLDAWGATVKERHAQNLAYLAKVASDALEKAQRAQQTRNVNWRRDTARRAVDDARAYMDFFGIRRKRPAMPEVAWASALDRARRIESPDPVRDAAKFKARERRQAKMRAALQAEFDSYCAEVAEYNAAVGDTRAMLPDSAQVWRDTGRWPDAERGLARPYGRYRLQRDLQRAGFTLPQLDDLAGRRAVLLRVNGEEIETSQGARIPLAAAPMVWAAVQRVRSRGEAWEPSGLNGMKIGNYAVSCIAADGTLTAGCHIIPFAELSLMATRLGL